MPAYNPLSPDAGAPAHSLKEPAMGGHTDRFTLFIGAKFLSDPCHALFADAVLDLQPPADDGAILSGHHGYIGCPFP